jgi:two-component system, NtrC family, nitrogen regulation response regulator GlnG
MDDAARILVVDDDAAVAWAVSQALQQAGYQVDVVADAARARRQVRTQRPDLVLTDVRMPGESGLDLLEDLHQQYPLLPVVVMTAFGSVDVAVQAVRRGAFEYLPKPLDLNRLEEVVRLAVDAGAIAARAEPGSECLPDHAMIGSAAGMQEVYRRIAAAADTDVSVLITGPTGSGKELVARALHRYSASSGAFLAVNCGALPDNLVESELFGHEAGAFTDARNRAIGRIEAARGGTLLLDEVGELPASAQVKLLRFLEDKRFTRVGGTEEVQADVRIIAATHRDLEQLTAKGAFRSDLAYRLQVVHIPVPGLAEHPEDLPELARHFLARTAARLGRPLALTESALQALRGYTWPGNVRELRHVIEEAAVLATGGVIAPEYLRLSGQTNTAPGLGLEAAIRRELQQLADRGGEIHQLISDQVERVLIQEAIARHRGNQLQAAAYLGINRITLKKRMDQFGL